MVIPANAKNPDLAHEFINFASDYEGAYDNSSFVGYSSANQEVMDTLSGEGGDYEGINAYVPRSGNPNDEVFEYNENTSKADREPVEQGEDRGEQRELRYVGRGNFNRVKQVPCVVARSK